jgi:hypothetical protein
VTSLFIKLWSSYPNEQFPCKKSDGKPAWENQCAIRMSIALQGAGVSLTAYSDPKCAHGHARGAEALANHLHRILFWPKKGSYKEMADFVRARKGIVFFKNLNGNTTDHIDLWSGAQTKTGWYDTAVELWFWKLE